MYYCSVTDIGGTKHFPDITAFGDKCNSTQSEDVGDWNLDTQDKNCIAPPSCLLDAASGICDKMTKTVNCPEPKPAFIKPEKTCQESGVNKHRFTKSNDNFSSALHSNLASQSGHYSSRKLDFVPKFESRLENMEENRLEFPPLYGNNATSRTILDHNPLTKADKYFEGKSDTTVDRKLGEEAFFRNSILKYENEKNCIMHNNDAEDHTKGLGMLPDGSDTVVKADERSTEASRLDNINSVPAAANHMNDVKINNRPKKYFHMSQVGGMKSLSNKEKEIIINMMTNIDIPKNSESRYQSSQEAISPSSLPHDIGDNPSASKLECSQKAVKAWMGISEEDSPAATDVPTLLPSPGESQRRKSLRACKGQRYREFMSEGRLVLGKRNRRTMANSSSDSANSVDHPASLPRRERQDSDSSTMSEKVDSIYMDTSRELDIEVQPPVKPSTTGQVQISKPVYITIHPVKTEIISTKKQGSKKTVTAKHSSNSSKEGLSQPGGSSVEKKTRKHSDASGESHSDTSPKKRFKAADFNLDEKIEALPSLSLEEFQLKKKARKKRNSSSSCTRRSMPISSSVAAAPTAATKFHASHLNTQIPVLTETSGSEGGQHPLTIKSAYPTLSISTTITTTSTVTTHLVGSQKRKARKQCITRLDPENVHTARDTAVVEPDVLNNIGLATLAEVAAAKKRLTK